MDRRCPEDPSPSCTDSCAVFMIRLSRSSRPPNTASPVVPASPHLFPHSQQLSSGPFDTVPPRNQIQTIPYLLDCLSKGNSRSRLLPSRQLRLQTLSFHVSNIYWGTPGSLPIRYSRQNHLALL